MVPKRPNFVLLFLCHKEASKLQENHKKFSKLRFKSCLALHWSLELITDAYQTFHGL